MKRSFFKWLFAILFISLPASLFAEDYIVDEIKYSTTGEIIANGISMNEKGVNGEDRRKKETLSFKVNGVSFTMIKVEAGTFQMGSTTDDRKEKPVHQVTLTRDYYIGETEVTQELWKAVMGSNPSYFTTSNQQPVEQVSWNDCQTFITKLNELTGKKFRLPTEAEWEFAARGGNASKGFIYSGSNRADDVAWTNNYISSGRTIEVSTMTSNELGIYDMSGNVKEWCQDWFDYYSSEAQTNPTGPTSGSVRVFRGGDYLRCGSVAVRYDGAPSHTSSLLGLRLVLDVPRDESVKFSELKNCIEIRVKDVKFKMIKVEAGTFQMGSARDVPFNKLIHQVTLTKDFFIGETEVTQELWKAVMGSNPSRFTNSDQLPVETVSWYDCQAFIAKLNELTGKKFRLPTEAEWEFAARGGNASKGYTFSGSEYTANVAIIGEHTYQVATMAPNELGIYDMSGNVEEWCQDWYGDYGSSAQTNPTGPSSGKSRVIRGGSYKDSALSCRVIKHIGYGPSLSTCTLGMRLVLVR